MIFVTFFRSLLLQQTWGEAAEQCGDNYIYTLLSKTPVTKNKTLLRRHFDPAFMLY